LTDGPKYPFSIEIDETKYRLPGESFREKCSRVADFLADDKQHFYAFRDILLHQRFLPAGRIQAGAGAPRKVTLLNCFVSQTIDDSMEGIMKAATDAAKTMRMGGGIGYDFSTLRPRNDRITTLDSGSSGAVSFMQIFDAVCKTISSAGNRRGAQMGCLRVDHPDIEEFVRAKQNETSLTQFNISVLVTNAFMDAVKSNDSFELKFGGRVYKRVSARSLWDEIMRSNWDWAEPGVIFIDRINQTNNLRYTEEISATNPCSEQPLPPGGACLLGSFNLTKYVRPHAGVSSGFVVDLARLKDDIPVVLRAMDNINDRSIYPLPEQAEEARLKRRIGIGVTGLANALEIAGFPYASAGFLDYTGRILELLSVSLYNASTYLAKEKGAFPLFSAKDYLAPGTYASTLPDQVKEQIKVYGIRNSHLTSIAPTGTISCAADNISSGIEPPYSLSFERTIQTKDGPVKENVTDFAYREYAVIGRTALDITAEDHVAVLNVAQKYVDSSVSKTVNVGDKVEFEDFKKIYQKAYDGGAKGCSTFRAAGKRNGIFAVSAPQEGEGTACYINPETGIKECS
jgi:ribonucleoside-diphosphate reductase alpha chain